MESLNEKQHYHIVPIKVDVLSDLKTINFYLVKTENELILVDAGLANDACWDALEETLKNNGWEMEDITEIILTHNHGDHVGLVNRLTSRHPIPVYAHQKSIPRLKRHEDFLNMRADFFEKLYEEMGCGEAGKQQVAHIRRAIEKNRGNAIQAEITPINSRHSIFQVEEVPGHAPDHIALHHETDNLLLSGDLLINHISSNAIVEPDESGERLPTLSQQEESLQKVRDLGLKKIYPGHSIIIEEPDQIITRRIDGISNKANKMKRYIQEGLTTANDIAQAYYKKSYTIQFSLVMSEVIGHLDYLERNGEVAKQMNQGIWHYKVK